MGSEMCIRDRERPEWPAGIEDCDSATLAKWEASRYAMPPYQFKKELGVVTSKGEERPPNADERERLHGFRPGHTQGFSEHERMCFLGNTFHCVTVAYLLAFWAVNVGYLSDIPTTTQLWIEAGYGTESASAELASRTSSGTRCRIQEFTNMVWGRSASR